MTWVLVSFSIFLTDLSSQATISDEFMTKKECLEEAARRAENDKSLEPAVRELYHTSYKCLTSEVAIEFVRQTERRNNRSSK